jgi:hypothetical protein
MGKFQGLKLLSGLLLFSCPYAFCQDAKPGIDGMAPPRWITFRHTQAPGRSYKTISTQEKIYTQEDFFFKAWIPVIHKSKYSFAISPQFRTEQLELKDGSENAIHSLSNWSLRYAGIEARSIFKVDSSSWLVFGANVNKSGNFHDNPLNSYPLNYTLSAAFLNKKSNNKEFGFGLIANKNYTNFIVLPILIYHYNYSSKAGVEISLPYRIAWRYNASSKDIFYLKAEAQNRNYFIRLNDTQCSFRRTDVDLGMAYNRQITKMIGVELFGGYRKNISNKLPTDVVAGRRSGFAFSFELYIRPPKLK